MSGLEVNKIIASIIFAVLIVTLIGHFGDLIINIDHHNDKETAYKIDVDEAPTVKNYLKNALPVIIMKKVVLTKLVHSYGI